MISKSIFMAALNHDSEWQLRLGNTWKHRNLGIDVIMICFTIFWIFCKFRRHSKLQKGFAITETFRHRKDIPSGKFSSHDNLRIPSHWFQPISSKTFTHHKTLKSSRSHFLAVQVSTHLKTYSRVEVVNLTSQRNDVYLISRSNLHVWILLDSATVLTN